MAPDSEFANTAYTREDLGNGLLAGTISKKLAEKLFPNVAVSDSDVEKHWETVKDRFKAGWSSTIRAAFLPTKAAAEDVAPEGDGRRAVRRHRHGPRVGQGREHGPGQLGQRGALPRICGT